MSVTKAQEGKTKDNDHVTLQRVCVSLPFVLPSIVELMWEVAGSACRGQ